MLTRLADSMGAGWKPEKLGGRWEESGRKVEERGRKVEERGRAFKTLIEIFEVNGQEVNGALVKYTRIWNIRGVTLTCAVSDKGDKAEVSNQLQTVNLRQYPQSSSIVSAWEQASQSYLVLVVNR